MKKQVSSVFERWGLGRGDGVIFANAYAMPEWGGGGVVIIMQLLCQRWVAVLVGCEAGWGWRWGGDVRLGAGEERFVVME